MFRRTRAALLAAILAPAASIDHAQTTRYGVELIDQWSLFTCKAKSSRPILAPHLERVAIERYRPGGARPGQPR